MRLGLGLAVLTMGAVAFGANAQGSEDPTIEREGITLYRALLVAAVWYPAEDVPDACRARFDGQLVLVRVKGKERHTCYKQVLLDYSDEYQRLLAENETKLPSNQTQVVELLRRAMRAASAPACPPGMQPLVRREPIVLLDCIADMPAKDLCPKGFVPYNGFCSLPPSCPLGYTRMKDDLARSLKLEPRGSGEYWCYRCPKGVLDLRESKALAKNTFIFRVQESGLAETVLCRE